MSHKHKQLKAERLNYKLQIYISLTGEGIRTCRDLFSTLRAGQTKQESLIDYVHVFELNLKLQYMFRAVFP